MLSEFTLSFQAGIAGDRLPEPYFLPARLTGAVCNSFLQNFLPELLEDVNLQTRMNLWSMHDGAPQIFFLQFGSS
jgi:hypothetical protein